MITKEVRALIYLRDSVCVYCGVEPKPKTLDHIIPKSKGGEDSIDNLVLACRDCNQRKADTMVKDLAEAIQLLSVKIVHYTRKKIQPVRLSKEQKVNRKTTEKDREIISHILKSLRG